MSVGTRVRARREELGLSQERLAEAAGVHRVTIVNVEAGESRPNVDTLVRLAAALNTTVGALLGETEAVATTGTEVQP